jgi:hypothetical protein
MRPRSLRSAPLSLLLGGVLSGLVAWMPAGQTTSVAAVVKAFCLSAYQADLKKQGKSLSLSQMERTCGCVGERVAQGSDVEDAHDACGRHADQRAVRGPSPQANPGTIN